MDSLIYCITREIRNFSPDVERGMTSGSVMKLGGVPSYERRLRSTKVPFMLLLLDLHALMILRRDKTMGHIDPSRNIN